jgi:hypothetical protein
MRWIDITPSRRQAIINAAAARLALDDMTDDTIEDNAPASGAGAVTIADLSDYARGRALRRSEESIRSAVRTDLVMRRACDRLLDRYSKVGIPLAAAASSGAIKKRRQVELGAEVEWLESSAEPNTVFVRVHVPPSMRPVKELILLGPDGDLRGIRLLDEGDEVEVLVERNSVEFGLLVNEASKLWLR